MSGNGGRDRVKGGPGRDKLKGGGGKDRIEGGGGKDKLSGGAGNDRLKASDRSRDKVNCGAGKKDRAVVDRRDKVSRSCEKVTLRGKKGKGHKGHK
jgi:hypothetical protein